jgi:hypothetical protein
LAKKRVEHSVSLTLAGSPWNASKNCASILSIEEAHYSDRDRELGATFPEQILCTCGHKTGGQKRVSVYQPGDNTLTLLRL